MRLLVRCDGAPAVGMGHVVRCTALAQAIRERECTVEFAMRADRPEGVRAVEDEGFCVHLIQHDDDAIELAKTYDAVLVDNYEIDAGALRRFSLSAMLAVIDDPGDRDLSAARWVLNQNLGAEELACNLSPDAVALFGPAYALLRPEFARVRAERARTVDPLQRSVLVTFGGGDVANYLAQVLRALQAVDEPLDIVLLGQQSVPFASRHNVRAVRANNGVAELMAASDVAVTAAGTTTWELCCMRVPSFAIPIAENQRIVASGLQRSGAMRVYTSFDAAVRSLPADVPALLRDAVQRRELAERAGSLVDGLGAVRAAESLIALTARA